MENNPIGRMVQTHRHVLGINEGIAGFKLFYFSTSGTKMQNESFPSLMAKLITLGFPSST